MTSSTLGFWKNIPAFKWIPSDDVYFNWNRWLPVKYSNKPTLISIRAQPSSSTNSSFFSSVYEMNDMNRRLSWIFRLSSDQNKFSFYLLLQSAERQPVTARYKVCLANNDNNEVLHSKLGKDAFNVEKNGMEQQNPKGFEEFISFTELLSLYRSGYISVHCNNTPNLKLYCYIAIEPLSQKRIESLSIQRCSLLTDIGNLLYNSKFSDVILCANGKEFPAHKAILAQRSPVFEAMFLNDMTEKTGNKVIIEDIEEDAMVALLDYIYSGDIDISSSIAVDVLHAAEKYNLPRLKAACEKQLVGILSAENAVNLLITADKYNATQLKTAAVDIISEFPKKVSSTEQWDTMLNTRPDLIKLCLTAVFAEMEIKK